LIRGNVQYDEPDVYLDSRLLDFLANESRRVLMLAGIVTTGNNYNLVVLDFRAFSLAKVPDRLGNSVNKSGLSAKVYVSQGSLYILLVTPPEPYQELSLVTVARATNLTEGQITGGSYSIS
jgi:hypothetical protein